MGKVKLRRFLFVCQNGGANFCQTERTFNRLKEETERESEEKFAEGWLISYLLSHLPSFFLLTLTFHSPFDV